MPKKYEELEDEDLKKDMQKNYITFMVILAFIIGVGLTFTALKVLSKSEEMFNIFPIGIMVICIFPLFKYLNKTNKQKKELKKREILE